jgi:hypothetical protein
VREIRGVVDVGLLSDSLSIRAVRLMGSKRARREMRVSMAGSSEVWSAMMTVLFRKQILFLVVYS